MSRRLGSGEYERTDVEVRQSTFEARYKFLQTLQKKRSYWFIDLLRLFNSDALPKELLDSEKIDNTVYFFLQYFTEEHPHEIEIPINIISVPLINYYRYFFGKEVEIKQLEENELQKTLDSSEHISLRSNAIKKIIPSAKELKTRKDAEILYQSLETWAKDYNLNEVWLLDFALIILRAFKSNFDFELLKIKNADFRSNIARNCRVSFEWNGRNSISQAISEYRESEVFINRWSGIDDLGKLPEFEYRWRDFKLLPNTWLPRISSRKVFAKEMNEKLNEAKINLQNTRYIWNYLNENALDNLLHGYHKYLESYCDGIEKQKTENTNETFFLPIDLSGLGTFRWFPSKECRTSFIENTLAELKIKIVSMKKAAESLNTFTKRDFNIKLNEYCNQIENLLPKNWKKPPQKYSENKHFEWLVDFQVAPCKTYTEIAENNGVDIKTVREAMGKLANIIGITLRISSIGRPKGSKDSETTIRQLKIHKL